MTTDNKPLVKKLGRFMSAYPVSNGKLTPWIIKDSRGHVLGEVEWYQPWAQFVFCADDRAVFSHDCLNHISVFLRTIRSDNPSKEVSHD